MRDCDRAALLAIDAARAAEGLQRLLLPADFERMTVADQTVLVTNAERTSRGLPPWSPDEGLSHLAQQGVIAGSDPDGPAGTTWASNIASGVMTVLEADYEWMYNDGPGGPNIDCSSDGAPGCWEHRDNILSPWPGTVGAASQQIGNQRFVLGEVMVASNQPN